MPPKPLCVIVTGRPGSGKITLARQLGEALSLPVISRDSLKEGYVEAQGVAHAQLPVDMSARVSELFSLVSHTLASGVSVVIKAVFQHPRRVFHHGDEAVAHFQAMGSLPTPSPYTPPELPIPTLHVSTEGTYQPGLEEILHWLSPPP